METMLVLNRNTDHWFFAFITIRFMSYMSIHHPGVQSEWARRPDEMNKFFALTDNFMNSKEESVSLNVDETMTLLKLADMFSKAFLTDGSTGKDSLAESFFLNASSSITNNPFFSDESSFISFYLKYSTIMFDSLRTSYADDPDFLEKVSSHFDYPITYKP